MLKYKEERETSEKRHYHNLESVRQERQQTRLTFLQGREARPASERRVPTRNASLATDIFLPASDPFASRSGGQSRTESRSGSALNCQILRLDTASSYNRMPIRSRPRTQSSTLAAGSPGIGSPASPGLLSRPNTNVGQSLRWWLQNPSPEGLEPEPEKAVASASAYSSLPACTTVFEPAMQTPSYWCSSPDQNCWSSWYRRQLGSAEGRDNTHMAKSYDALEARRLSTREKTVSFQDHRFSFQGRDDAESMWNPTSPGTGSKHMTRSTRTTGKIAWSEPTTDKLCPYDATLVFVRRSL